MKKLEFGQTVSILANVGVIAGIVLLAYEMQQNTLAVRSAASQGVQDQFTDLYSQLTVDPLAGIYLIGMPDPARLAPADAVKLRAFLANIFSALENLWSQVQEGSYEESRALGYYQMLRNVLEYPAAKQHWEDRAFVYSAEFRAFVDNEIMHMETTGGTTILDAIE